jgi:pimeloyl-ACP methyl ester carboxylesterase
MTASEGTGAQTITEHELAQCQRANQTGRQPVVFVHGLWLLPSSWDRWAQLFEEHGYVALTPGWPDDPDTVAEATAHPEVFTGKSVGQVADHFATIIGGLDQQPVVIGHSFGGLLTQILAGRGLARVSVNGWRLEGTPAWSAPATRSRSKRRGSPAASSTLGWSMSRKCRCGSVESPELPQAASGWSAATRSPGRTRTEPRRRWGQGRVDPAAQVEHHVVAEDPPGPERLADHPLEHQVRHGRRGGAAPVVAFAVLGPDHGGVGRGQDRPAAWSTRASPPWPGWPVSGP